MEAGGHRNPMPENTPAKPARSQFAIEGMSCPNCVHHVTQAIQEVPGVADVTVALEPPSASVRWVSGVSPEPGRVVTAVQQAGFKAKLDQESGAAAGLNRKRSDGWRTNLWIGAVCTVPLMAGEWLFGLGASRPFQWASFVLAAVVQVFAGARFYRGAWNHLKARSANMDTLVALGSTTAFAFSVFALFHGGASHLYFMEAAAIITLISLGHWLEARMSQRAAGSLQKLLHLAPAQACRRNPDGSESAVPVAQLVPNDLVVLRPGDRVPADGCVIEGDSAVDESMLTGEPMPVDKSVNATAYAGTINLNGRLVLRVTASGQATALANIVAAVQRAQNSRAAIQRLGDQVSNVFVPAVLLVAVATGLWWGLAPESAQRSAHWVAAHLHVSAPAFPALTAAFIHAAAVLIIACPCAMGLATPIAIMAGANAGAQRGILIRDGIALEKAGTITTVVFDKTGTLTSGQPSVAQFATYVGGERPKVHETKLAAAMARRSNHPLSQAIGRVDTEDVPLLNWEEVRGSGLLCYVHLSAPASRLAVARLGSLPWLRDAGVDLGCGSEFIERWATQGATLLGIAVDRWLMGLIALQDTIQPQAADVIEELKSRGFEVSLLTGDSRRTALAIGKQVGIRSENVHAEVHPEEKAELIRRLQANGERVAFVGDGINDAPALEQADLGIAVSRASDIAFEAADMILLRADIQSVSEGLRLARTTLRTIKQNLFWAFFYNALGVPLAALGLLNPMICAAAMGLSDLVVIGNALGLRHWKLVAWRKWRREFLRHFEAGVLRSK
jgi:P-type Cu+ transporter